MTTLELQTLAVVRDLPSGDVVVSAAADLGAACVGDEELALVELSTYLTTQLARVGPEEVARHALPSGSRLHVTNVAVPRDDLPRRFGIPAEIAVSSLIIPNAQVPGRPARDEAWLVILVLGHTVFVEHGEDIDEIVRKEVKRLVAAREIGPREYLALLPGEGDELVPLTVMPELGEQGPQGRAASLRRALVAHEKRKTAVKVLESVARPLHSLWRGDRDHGRPLHGRERELSLLAGLLGGKERLSCLIVGEPRTGKSALLRAWFERAEAAGAQPLVYATSGAQLVAGMSGLGQWQERVRRVLESAETLDAVLVFDDVADLFAEHGRSVVDLASAIKPYLEAGRVRVVGELGPDRLDFVETRSPGFFASLYRVRLEPLDGKASLAALREHVRFDRARYPGTATLTEDACAHLVDLAARYLPYQAFPGKVVALYRELRTARSIESRPEPIDAVEVFESMSARTGVPAFLLRDDRSLLESDVVAALGRRVIGQVPAVRAVAQTLCVMKARLQPPKKPLATFLFVGPTGVGKTALARALAQYRFGSETRLVRFDMSEYADPTAADRLFQGGASGDGLLTRKIREQPFSVVLLDEIEKAHPSVLDVLLQVFGEGRLTDARGKTATFEDAILVLTSNLGAAGRSSPIGIAASAPDEGARYVEAVEAAFRPELVNRLDRIVVFEPLAIEHARGVVRLVVDRVAARRGIADRGIALEVSERALDALVEGGFSRAHGARSVRRFVEDRLVTPVAELIAREAEHAGQARMVAVAIDDALPATAPGFVALATAANDTLVVRMERRLKSAAQRDLVGLDGITAIRRELASYLALEPIVALREQAQLVGTQLYEATTAERKRKKRRSSEGARDVTALMTERHRLGSIVEALDGAFRDILDLEELAIDAVFEARPIAELRAEVEQARRRLRGPLARAMVALEPRRDAAVILMHELDGGRAFDLYLVPMLREASRLGWTVDAHFPDEQGEGWPPASAVARGPRRFGPPRPVAELSARLEGRTGPRPRSVLLSVRGELAGIFLAFESGLHRYVGLAKNLAETNLMVVLLALEAKLDDASWVRPAVAPLTPPQASIHKRGRPGRLIDAAAGTLTILGEDSARLALEWSDYWARIEEVVLEHLLLCARDDRFDRSAFLTEAAIATDEVAADAKGGA